MKTKNIYSALTLLLLLLSGIIISSCSKSLSREDAANAIKQKYDLPHNEYQDFQFYQTRAVKYTVPFHYYYYLELDARKLGISITEKERRQLEDLNAKREEAVRNCKFSNPSKLPLFEALEKEGLIAYSIQLQDLTTYNKGYDGWGYVSAKDWRRLYRDFECTGTASHIATPTEMGKKYIANGNEVMVARIEFGEVTGIVERKEFNVSEVNFTIKRTNITPFGRIVFNLNEETNTRSVTFAKYDDGWRIN